MKFYKLKRNYPAILSCAAFLASFAFEGAILPAADDTAQRAVTNQAIVPAAPCVAVPGDWTLSSPDHGAIMDDYFEITGTDRSTQYWKSAPFDVVPGGLYRFKMNACWFGGGSGCLPAGIDGVTNDYHPGDTQEPESLCTRMIRIPERMTQNRLTVGRWGSDKTIRFTAPSFVPVRPIYQGIPSVRNGASQIAVSQEGKPVVGANVSDGTRQAVTNENGVAVFASKYAGDFLPLAYGEKIDGTKYRFYCFRNAESGNFDRTLDFATASFNSCRWCFGNEAEVIYKIRLAPVRIGADTDEQPEPLRFTDAKFTVDVPYYTGGRCIAEASVDGKTWKQIGTLEEKGVITGTPDGFFLQPVETVYFRCRGEKNDSSAANFQVYSMKFDATVDSADYTGDGGTIYTEVTDSDAADSDANKNGSFTAVPLFYNEETFYCAVTNNGDKPLDWNPAERTHVVLDGGKLAADCWQIERFGAQNPLPPKGRAIIAQEFSSAQSGKTAKIDFQFDRNYTFTRSVFPYFIQDYTHKIDSAAGSFDGVSLSWCEADRKVPRDPKVIQIQDAEPVKIAAPRNDFESFQVVVRTDRPLAALSAAASDLTGPDGAILSSANIQLRYGYYHNVTHPTDATCAVGWYMDALVPFAQGADGAGAPVNLGAGRNLPIFLTAYVPFGTAAGDYTGTLSLTDATGTLDAKIPFTLTVWDFDQPAKNRFETAYGFSVGSAFWYQNISSEEDKRLVWESYLQSASDHRISFYNPVPLDGFSVKFDKETLTTTFDFERYDREMERVMSKYNVTNFQLPVSGLGGGTFQSRWIGKLADFADDTPEYQTLMTDYLGKLEAHLAEKGWLDKCYCYWFDEPDPKDYEFVATGFGKLKKYGPGIGRMLTEEPGDKLCDALAAAGGDVTIWCPISDAYNVKEAQKRMEKGERFWWYVCCGPKAPYCTEFTDHAACELRVWHWQAFERKIVGSLIWTTNWWTSSTAFPNEAQNPYIDPMCYVSDGTMAPGTKSYWGNGDGRFLYPPLAAAVPGRNNGQPILADPVCSIRWEELREGIEDYEMLLTLRERFEARRAALTEEQKTRIEKLFDFSDISSGMTQFTVDPAVILSHREKIAQAIMELQ